MYVPETVDETPHLDDLTPREIVRELDKYVIGQGGAKRAVAIALRNRIRRQKLPPEMAEEVMPKNIIMIGPTGVGKTEIARRLAKLANSPFLKVEASKFTEVGYVGRDVESMIRDLVEIAILAVAIYALLRLLSRTRGSGMMHAEEQFRAALQACDHLGARGLFLTKYRAQLPAPLPVFDLNDVTPIAAFIRQHAQPRWHAEAIAAAGPEL